MPRKPNPAPTAEHAPLDTEALQQASNALTIVGERSKEVAERFGDGQPYDRARCINEARFFMSQSAEAMLEAGKRLVQIKENEPHGDFLDIVENRLGLATRTAQRMMAASIKYLAPALAAKAPTLALLGKSKLFELMTEDDEELDALAEGGTVAGLDLDDIQSMSARELRAALVEARQTAAAKDKIIAKKDAKLNKLAEDEEKRKALALGDDQATLDLLRDATVSAELALAQLTSAIGGVLSGSPTEATATAARHAGEYLAQRLADLINDHGIPVDFAELITPTWLNAAEAQAALSREPVGKAKGKGGR